MKSSVDAPESIQIFVSSAPEDTKLRKKIEQHLSLLQRQGFVQSWHEQQMMAGAEQQSERDEHLQKAQLILLLISANFMSSEQCWKEMEQALELSKQGNVQVIPVLLGPLSGWQDAPFSKLNILPDNKKPISQWSQKELAITNVVDGIRLVVEERRLKHNSLRQKYGDWDRLIVYPPQPHPNAVQAREGTVKELYARLIAPETTTVILTGIAGAGKSTLANLVYHYVENQRRTGHSFFTAKTLMLRMHPTVTLFTLIETLFTVCNEPVPDISHLTPQDLAALLLRFLESDSHPCLIILDQFEQLLNHNGGEALGQDVKVWLPLLNKSFCRSRILLVSRIQPKIIQESAMKHISSYHTNGLNVQEGVGLLRNWGVQASSAELMAIAEHFGGHALALTLIASLLLNRRIEIDTIFKEREILTFRIEEIERLIEQMYIHQLDDAQRAVIFAFSVFREPVPLNAVLSVVNRPSLQGISWIYQVLESLLALHLLQESNHGYQLQSLLADYARISFVPDESQENSGVRAVAHENAALYYLQQKRQEGLRKSGRDMHEGMEAAWHFCQSGQWQKAYEVIVQEELFTNLLRWGGGASLLEIYKQLPLEQEEYKEPVQVASIQKELGEIYHKLGQKHKAQTNLEQAWKRFQAFGDRRGEAQTLLILGEVYSALEQKEQSQECYEKVLKMCEEKEIEVEDDLKSVALNNIGKIYHELGQDELALSYYTEALSLHTTIDEEATTLNNVGSLYKQRGEIGRASRQYQKALRFFQEIGNRRGEGSVLHNLGGMYYEQEKMQDAQEYYERAWNIFYEIGDRWSEKITLESLCVVYLVQESYKRVIACIIHIQKISSEIVDGKQAEMKGIISLLRRHFGVEQFERVWEEVISQGQFITKDVLDD